MDVPARLLTDTATLPTRAHEDDAAFDLCSDADLVLAPGRREAVPTGVVLELPEGVCGLVLPRSGLAARHGITVLNSPGLIDPGYRGEIMVILLNTDAEQPFEIERGERIAQLLLTRTEAWRLLRGDGELELTARGARGLGSTGR